MMILNISIMESVDKSQNAMSEKGFTFNVSWQLKINISLCTEFNVGAVLLY